MQLQPGKLYACSESDYRAFPAANYSTLKAGRESALAMKWAIDTPRESTEAMDLGRAVEEMAFGSPDSVVAAPDVDRRTKAGKEEWAAFHAANAGKIVLTADAYADAFTMHARLSANPDAVALTRAAKFRQAVAVWVDEATGVTCKARIDALTPGVCLTDLKTTRAALDDRSLGAEVARMGYHIQAAFYSDGFKACTGIDTPFTLVCVQNRPPFDCVVKRLDDVAIEAGRKWYRHLLGVWKAGKETGIWPGFPAGIGTLEIPKWEVQAADRAEWRDAPATEDDHSF